MRRCRPTHSFKMRSQLFYNVSVCVMLITNFPTTNCVRSSRFFLSSRSFVCCDNVICERGIQLFTPCIRGIDSRMCAKHLMVAIHQTPKVTHSPSPENLNCDVCSPCSQFCIIMNVLRGTFASRLHAARARACMYSMCNLRPYTFACI